MHSEIEIRNKITLLSFFMAVFIVVRHGINYEIYGLTSGGGYWIQRYLRVFSDLMVPSFFALSGYLFYRNYTTEKLLGKLKSRIFSLLIPYLIWNLAAYMFYQIIRFVPGVTESMNHSGADFSVMDMFADMLCGGRNVTWFIRFLLGFCMVAPIAWYCIKTILLGALSLVLLIVAGMTLNFNFLSYLAIFLFGGWIGVNWPDNIRVKYSTRVRCLSLLLLLSTVLAETIYSSTSGGGGENLFFRWGQICLLWIVTDNLAVRRPIPPWLKISFFLYVTHSMVLESIEKIFLICLGRTTLGAWIDLICAPIVTLCIVELTALLLRRYVPAVWEIVNGGRK